MFEFLNTDMFSFDESTVEEEMTIVDESTEEMTEEEDTMMESYEAIECQEDSIDEAMSRIALETVENYHRIVEAVMIDEFNEYMATKEEVVYEEGRIQKVTDAIQKFIEAAWQKIKGVYDKMLQTLDKMLNDDSSFIKKYEDKIKNSSSVKMKGYKYTISNGNSVYNSVSGAFDKAVGDYKKYLDFDPDKGFATEGNLEAIKKATEGLDKTLRSSIGGDGSVESFNKELRKKFCGSEDQVEMEISPADVINALKTNKEQKDRAKDGYNLMKKSFNRLIKETKAIKSEAVKATSRSKVKSNNVASVIGMYNTACKKTIAVLGQVYKMHYSAIAASRHQAKAAARKMAGSSDSKEKKSTNESAIDAIQFI